MTSSDLTCWDNCHVLLLFALFDRCPQYVEYSASRLNVFPFIRVCDYQSVVFATKPETGPIVLVPLIIQDLFNII